MSKIFGSCDFGCCYLTAKADLPRKEKKNWDNYNFLQLQFEIAILEVSRRNLRQLTLSFLTNLSTVVITL
jgi:hypothetical protein